MLENLVLRRTVNPGTRISLYNSIRKTLELLRHKKQQQKEAKFSKKESRASPVAHW